MIEKLTCLLLSFYLICVCLFCHFWGGSLAIFFVWRCKVTAFSQCDQQKQRKMRENGHFVDTSQGLCTHTLQKGHFSVCAHSFGRGQFFASKFGLIQYTYYICTRKPIIYICIDGITCKTSIEALWIYYQLSRITGSRSLRWRARWTWRSRTCTSWFSRATPPSRRCIGWRMRWTSACLNSWGRTDRPTSGLPESGSFHLMRFAEGW